jgi:hypothetical protein
MMRADDGELYLEIRGATEERLRAGLIAVRAYISRCGSMRRTPCDPLRFAGSWALR